ncbi:MAG: hypothetical protein H6727_01345 [Myxococcales bacterium]|nr:hypothetical protein [Myxococcales bacterium]
MMKQTAKEQKLLLLLQLHHKSFKPAPKTPEAPVLVYVPQPAPLGEREAALELGSKRTHTLEKNRALLGL